MRLTFKHNVEKGGPGSGHFGHAGRPGQVGGSGSGSGGGLLSREDLITRGVSTIGGGGKLDVREAAQHGVGSFTKSQSTRIKSFKVGRFIDDYLPDGDKTQGRIMNISSTHYTIKINGKLYKKQFMPES